MGLHGYETAVRSLKETPWPEEGRWRVVLDLVYGNTLVTYASAYGWEIGRRERVDSKGVDLRAWTRDQIWEEATRAYVDAWERRESLSAEPVTSLPDYLIANDYPREVRGTLRDAVSYLFVDLLANTSGWTPAQGNDLFRLDLASLLQGDPETSRHLRLGDPSVHPILKVCAVLDDLESWHRGRGRREAALETRLERVRRLSAAFREGDDGAKITADLKPRLKSYRDVSWWAEGQFQLASLVMQEAAAGRLVRAREIALEGAKAYPGSGGGRRCESLSRGIESPSYGLQAMAADGLGRRSVLVTHRNLSELFLRAYAVDLDERVASASDYNLLPGIDEVSRLLAGKKGPDATWRVTLPATFDFETHRTFVTPPMTKPGLYVVVASAKEDFGASSNQVFATNLLLTDLVLVSRPDGSGGLEVRALSGASGEPAVGATVSLWRFDWQKGHRRLVTRPVGEDGSVVFEGGAPDGHSYFVTGTWGVSAALDPHYQSFFRGAAPGEREGTLVYTDRSVYRPGQKILWKVMRWRGRPSEARLAAAAGETVSVTLFDGNGEKVETRTVATNLYGTAAGEFVIPSGRLLGRWHLGASPNGSAQIRVEEYRRPTFEASFREPKEPLRLNRPATLVGDVRYYFGLPVTNGAVAWRVTREPVWPWSWAYGGGWGTTRAQTIAAGSASLREDGTFEVRFTPAADERQASKGKDVSWRYVATADVTDKGGETLSAERRVRLGFAAIEARLDPVDGFVPEETPATVVVRRTDLDGNPRPGAGSWRLLRLREPAVSLLPADLARESGPGSAGGAPVAELTPGDRLRARWETSWSVEGVLRSFADGEEVARGEIRVGSAPEARIDLGRLGAGAYRLRYRTIDDYGGAVETFRDLVVGGRRTSVAVPLVILGPSSPVRVGETARLLVASGIPGQRLTLDRYRAGRLLKRILLVAGKDSALVEIPVGEDDRGGFTLQVSALRDHQFLTASQGISVPWDDRQLDVTFATFRDRLAPGGKETWRVTVKGPGGRAEAATAEVLAYMYDRSLDVFALHAPPGPLSLLPSRQGAGGSRSSLGAGSTIRLFSNFPSPPSAPALSQDRLAGFDGYGVGGPGRRFPGRAKGDGGILGGLAGGAMAPLPAALAPMAMKVGEAVSADALEVKGDAVRPPPAGPAPLSSAPVRANFAETAFWKPQLLTDADGAVSLEFDVPDSVTSWNVWVHAVTKDLRGGSARKEARSVKELMVRPYLPRFLREGDAAELKVVVNDAGESPLSGEVSLDILDAETNASVLTEFGLDLPSSRRPFAVRQGSGTSVSFPVRVPRGVRSLAFRVMATSGDSSDGELRPVPVLPSRLRLVQSRFVTLKDGSKKVMSFPDLARADDPTLVTEEMVVTVDAQLFMQVLGALPYLVNYPYECTEQTLNRFLSTGIVSSLYRDYPAVRRMAERLSSRETPLETWDAKDPNRKMGLEETPWLDSSRGGRDAGHGLANVLDARVAGAEREASIAKLRKAQAAVGGFPWWPGGPPSPWMTLYVMNGFARAAEFGIDVPKEMVRKGWRYLARHYRDDWRRCTRDDGCWETLTYLNYVASSYPDETWTEGALTDGERKEILALSFRHWKQHTPLLKGYLALTLKRMGRPADARLVWNSVMDSARTTEEEGTFWAREERSWLWYADTTETHAFALRAMMELDPSDSRREGLVQWLLLDKKLSQWKSTRATAEVIYSLVHYLRKEGALSVREDVRVVVGTRTATFAFEPDRYEGKGNRLVITGEEVDPDSSSTVIVEKSGKGFAFASATWAFSTQRLPAEGRGEFFSVSRRYFLRKVGVTGASLKPLGGGATLSPGDQVEVQLSLKTKHAAEYVHLRDPRGAGFEPENAVSRYRWDLGIGWYEEVRDSGTNFFFEALPAGEYTFRYRVRVSMAGTFRIGPAMVQSIYAPEFNAYSAGEVLSVREN